jgi:methyltransferase (TIGR00027 family)
MMTGRTRFFDGEVESALAAGQKQVVICGAGYDDRALRFRTKGVRFFELDQGPTQEDKALRLHALNTDLSGLVQTIADFRHADVDIALAAAGHDATQPSLFICEGLLVYLDEPTIVRLVTNLAAQAAPGSTLAVSIAIHSDGLRSADVVKTANASRRNSSAEPWRTILPREQHLILLTRSGWVLDRVVDVSDLEPTAAPGHSLMVSLRLDSADAE